MDYVVMDYVAMDYVAMDYGVMGYGVMGYMSMGYMSMGYGQLEEDVKTLDRCDTGWGSVDISQYTDRKDEDDERRSPTPQPTLTEDVRKIKKQRSGPVMWTRRNTTPKCGRTSRSTETQVYSTEFCSGIRTVHRFRPRRCLSQEAMSDTRQTKASELNEELQSPTKTGSDMLVGDETFLEADRGLEQGVIKETMHIHSESSQSVSDSYEPQVERNKRIDLNHEPVPDDSPNVLNLNVIHRDKADVTPRVDIHSADLEMYATSTEKRSEAEKPCDEDKYSVSGSLKKQDDVHPSEEHSEKSKFDIAANRKQALQETQLGATSSLKLDDPLICDLSKDTLEAIQSKKLSNETVPASESASQSPILVVPTLKPAYFEFPEIIDVSRRHSRYICLLRSKSEGNWATTRNLPELDEDSNNSTPNEAPAAPEIVNPDRNRPRRGQSCGHNIGWEKQKRVVEEYDLRRSTLELDLAQKVILSRRVLESLRRGNNY
ncbi:hypothetical protein Btru_028560 [Bulinus truncatus]|nr:hypothetical protein Btru_028560 [Bulinus truncatus]